jgi:hypothetical protein
MSTRRIARRVVSMTSLENLCGHAVTGRTLATKVFHFPCHPFPQRCAGQGGAATPGCSSSLTGVRRRTGSGGARRIAWWWRRAVTLVKASTLATNEYVSGSVA